MTKSQALGDDLCVKLRMVGLSRQVVLPLVNHITRQVRAEGPENVVKRLKVLKQAAIDMLAGGEPKFPWVSHTAHGPRGPWRPVWTLLSRSSFKHKKRAFNAVMVYASLVLPKRAGPTRTQERKFLDSVEHTKTEVFRRQVVLKEAMRKDRFRSGAQALKKALVSRDWNPRMAYHIPDIREYLVQRYGAEEVAVRKRETQLMNFLGGSCGLAIHSFPQVQRCLGELGEDHFSLTHPWNGAHLDWRKVRPDVEHTIGVVGSTQEPGFKFRAFASPSPVVQCAMEGLKNNLLAALKLLPWDCTHDQEAGVRRVQEWLKAGHTVHSVDLSDATNNFPLSIQTALLKYLGVKEEDVKLLELVSRSPYRLTWDQDTTVTWDVGQPLGAGPSFMAFALAHACVALDAEISVGVTPGSSFLVLGDDFITNNDAVHAAYRSRLGELSCPISESKCISSNQIGEFAGKVIGPKYIYHGYKFRDVSNLSFMSVVRTLGSQAISRKLLTPDQYSYCQLVKEMPEPWGLGFNPSGRPFADRYADYLDLAEQRREAEPIRITAESLKTKWHCAAQHRVWRYYPMVERPQVVSRSRTVNSVRDQVWEMIIPGGRPVTLAKGDPRPDPLQGWSQKLAAYREALEEKGRTTAASEARLRAKEVSRTSQDDQVVSDPLITGGQTKSESSVQVESSWEDDSPSM